MLVSNYFFLCSSFICLYYNKNYNISELTPNSMIAYIRLSKMEIKINAELTNYYQSKPNFSISNPYHQRISLSFPHTGLWHMDSLSQFWNQSDLLLDYVVAVFVKNYLYANWNVILFDLLIHHHTFFALPYA